MDRVKVNVEVDREKMESKIKERLKDIKSEDSGTTVSETKVSEKKESERKVSENKLTDKKSTDKKSADKKCSVIERLTAKIESNKKLLIISGIVLFLVFLFIQLKYIYEVWFDPDELDIYSIGFEMAKGKVLYRDIPSQHMPWTYIFSCIFYFLGAHTATLQRLFFYVMFAGFWTYIVFAYKKYVNKWVLIAAPFIYHAILQHTDFATQILSEHLCVIGAQIFLLEFLVFLKKRDISIGSCIRMSIAVVMTFGTAFLMVFPLFYLLVGVVATEIKWRLEDPGTETRGQWWGRMLKRYIRLGLIIAIPWICMVIYMLATHSFHDFGFGAYTINRLYYPQYMAGLGGGLFSTFVAPLTEPCKYVLALAATDITPLFIFRLFMFVSVLYMAYKLYKKKGLIAGLTIYFFVFAFCTRGLFNYHGVPFIGAASITAAYVLIVYMYRNRDDFAKESLFKKCVTCTIIGIMGFAFFSEFQMSAGFISGSAWNYYQADTDALATVLDEDERLWQTTTTDTISYTAQRVTEGPSVSTPWMWDAVGKHQIDEFLENPSKVVLFQLGYETWGHKMADYAPEAYYFIVNNYKLLPSTIQIWVRNDCYEEACKKLGVDPNAVTDFGVSVSPFTVDPSEMPGKTPADRELYRKIQENGGVPEEQTQTEDTEGTEKKEETTEADTEKEDNKDKENKEETTEASEDDESAAEGPGAVIVTPNEGGVVYLDPDGNEITENTPGAVQAPDGSWVLPDDSDGPGQ